MTVSNIYPVPSLLVRRSTVNEREAPGVVRWHCPCHGIMAAGLTEGAADERADTAANGVRRDAHTA
jgi:hypothetical protein